MDIQLDCQYQKLTNEHLDEATNDDKTLLVVDPTKEQPVLDGA